MKRPLQSTYGDTLPVAAQKAVALRSKEAELLAPLKFTSSFVFDFHGIEVPLTEATTAEELIAEVTERHQERARLYDSAPCHPSPIVKKQGGKMGECLDGFILKAVQCGQLWGNRALDGDSDGFDQLRHIFEFNGIDVPFNPWKPGEAERILQVVNEALAARGSTQEDRIVIQ